MTSPKTYWLILKSAVKEYLLLNFVKQQKYPLHFKITKT